MKSAYVLKIGPSGNDIQDVFVVLAQSADVACAKLKKSVVLSDYAEGTVIQCVEYMGGNVIE